MDILSWVGVAFIDVASRHWTGIAFRIITTAQTLLKQNVQFVKTGSIRRVAEFDETSAPQPSLCRFLTRSSEMADWINKNERRRSIPGKKSPLSLTHPHTHTRTHSYTLSCSHTYSLRLSLCLCSFARTHTHTHIRTPSLPVSQSRWNTQRLLIFNVGKSNFPYGANYCW